MRKMAILGFVTVIMGTPLHLYAHPYYKWDECRNNRLYKCELHDYDDQEHCIEVGVCKITVTNQDYEAPHVSMPDVDSNRIPVQTE